jgi:tRNA A58 N-methylase Trm61
MPRKNESPPIPTNTCPYIDHVIHMVDELKDLAQENKLRFAESLYETIKGELEHIRNSNEMLRDSGKYWYQKNKNNR